MEELFGPAALGKRDAIVEHHIGRITVEMTVGDDFEAPVPVGQDIF